MSIKYKNIVLSTFLKATNIKCFIGSIFSRQAVTYHQLIIIFVYCRKKCGTTTRITAW